MSPTSSKKVVSVSEAPAAGTQKKLLTAEQRAKKRASDRKSRLSKKVKVSNTEQNLDSVTKERDVYRGQLFQCEKELKEAKDALREAYRDNGVLLEQNRSLLQQNNEVKVQVGDVNKLWSDSAQNEGHISEKWCHELNIERLQPQGPQPLNDQFGPAIGSGGSIEGQRLISQPQGYAQTQQPVQSRPFETATESGGCTMIELSKLYPQPQGWSKTQQYSIQSRPFETLTESGGYTMVELSKLHPQPQGLSKMNTADQPGSSSAAQNQNVDYLNHNADLQALK